MNYKHQALISITDLISFAIAKCYIIKIFKIEKGMLIMVSNILQSYGWSICFFFKTIFLPYCPLHTYSQ